METICVNRNAMQKEFSHPVNGVPGEFLVNLSATAIQPRNSLRHLPPVQKNIYQRICTKLFIVEL